MANYNRLQTGMTYDQVVQILGKEGKKGAELGTEKTAFKVVIYMWAGDGGGPDAELTVLFKDKKLDKKDQFGLK